MEAKLCLMFGILALISLGISYLQRGKEDKP